MWNWCKKGAWGEEKKYVQFSDHFLDPCCCWHDKSKYNWVSLQQRVAKLGFVISSRHFFLVGVPIKKNLRYANTIRILWEYQGVVETLKTWSKNGGLLTIITAEFGRRNRLKELWRTWSVYSCSISPVIHHVPTELVRGEPVLGDNTEQTVICWSKLLFTGRSTCPASYPYFGTDSVILLNFPCTV